MFKETIDCIDAGTEFCPCHLAEKGECICLLYTSTDDNNEDFEIVASKRIGIDYAEEAKDFLWRFYIKDNIYVSKK